MKRGKKKKEKHPVMLSDMITDFMNKNFAREDRLI
jgi:hypothetical protein